MIAGDQSKEKNHPCALFKQEIRKETSKQETEDLKKKVGREQFSMENSLDRDMFKQCTVRCAGEKKVFKKADLYRTI